jgi:hypothetical protein
MPATLQGEMKGETKTITILDYSNEARRRLPVHGAGDAGLRPTITITKRRLLLAVFRFYRHGGRDHRDAGGDVQLPPWLADTLEEQQASLS